MIVDQGASRMLRLIENLNLTATSNSPGVVRFSAESENIEFSLGRGLAGKNDEFSFAVGAPKTMLDGSENIVTSITVPSEAAETVDCKTYFKAR